MTCTFIESFFFYQQKSCLPNDCYYREKELLIKSLEKWENHTLLRPGHFGISSEVMTVFGPFFFWLCRWKFQTVLITIYYCFFAPYSLLVPFWAIFGMYFCRPWSYLHGVAFPCWIYLRRILYTTCPVFS